MNCFKQTVSLLLAICFFSACSVSVSTTDNPNKPIEVETKKTVAKNVIFMVGDGMGLTQITSGMLANNNTLHLEEFTTVGLSKTNSSAQLITDSAAGATAFSIGEKTFNGAIGVDRNNVPKETILERLGNNGYATGMIATCSITHATPASFYAHRASRAMNYEIASDMVDSPLDLFIGGGKRYFENRTNADYGVIDDRSIINELKAKGFQFINSLDELATLNSKVGYFIADNHPKAIKDGRDDILPNSIEPMISYLQRKSDKGFFMLVEGSQIDWGGHANESEYINTEMIDFDKAIGKVLEFAKKDGNTLVVITADHETGGYALGSKDNDYNQIDPKFTTGGHTGVMVPVFAYGPGSEQFGGIYNNNEIYHKMRKALNQ